MKFTNQSSYPVRVGAVVLDSGESCEIEDGDTAHAEPLGLVEPNRNASRDVWAAFAEANGVDVTDEDTRTDLIDKFTNQSDTDDNESEEDES